jgi:hypothetical protein
VTDTVIKIDPVARAKLELALAFGLLNFGLAIEGDAKTRSPWKTGNLRRSIHTAAFSKGKRIYGATDDNNRPVPDYAANAKGAMAVVGTNCGYGVYLELGTFKMAAQPYLGPALADNRANAAGLVKAGMTKSGVL